ncbi:hypothetical protein L4D09_26615 [Photobacterium makurazakiensis]|uniref:hypothetical protein n=1 Tax=Photobacterium makurazakiensis TaxID=2910234 RepID=UPI003D129B4C
MKARIDRALNAATIITWLSLIGICLLFSSNVNLEAAWRVIAVSISCIVACAAYHQITNKNDFQARDFIKALITLFSAIGLLLAMSLVMSEPSNAFYGLIFITFSLVLLTSVFTVLFLKK